MRSVALVAALLLGGVACTHAPAAPTAETVLAPDVRVRPLAPGVWLHVTLGETEGWGTVAANGLLIEDGDSALLVDTGWSPAQAERLIAWARDTLHRPVKAAVATHFHADRTGGIPALTARGIPVHGLASTVALAAKNQSPAPTQTFADSLTLGPAELFFPGPAHAPDNLVVYHRASGILFGGCAVKDAQAKNLGNLSDATPAAWPAAIDRVRERFPDVGAVIPGHGEPGTPALLTHTQELARAASVP